MTAERQGGWLKTGEDSNAQTERIGKKKLLYQTIRQDQDLSSSAHVIYKNLDKLCQVNNFHFIEPPFESKKHNISFSF